MYKPRQSRLSSILWYLRNEAHVLTKTVINCLIIAQGTLKVTEKVTTGQHSQAGTCWEKGQLAADSARAQFLIKRGAGFSSSLAVAPPRLRFPGPRKTNHGRNLPHSPPSQPWHKEAAWQLEHEEREGAVIPNSVTPKRSPPLFCQPQYFTNPLKSRWLVFLSDQL